MNVLVGISTQEYAHIYFSLALARLCKFTKHNTILSIGRGSTIADNRNRLIHSAKAMGADFIFMLDNDVSFPGDTLDRLVEAAQTNNWDVVGAGYLKKTPPHGQTAVLKKDPVVGDILEDYVEANYLPAGMTLIRCRVFDKLSQPYFFHSTTWDATKTYASLSTEDYPFCRAVRDAGMRLWLDTRLSLELVHWMGLQGVQWVLEEPGYKYVTIPSDHVTSLQQVTELIRAA